MVKRAHSGAGRHSGSPTLEAILKKDIKGTVATSPAPGAPTATPPVVSPAPSALTATPPAATVATPPRATT
jgi:hypothetical protein